MFFRKKLAKKRKKINGFRESFNFFRFSPVCLQMLDLYFLPKFLKNAINVG